MSSDDANPPLAPGEGVKEEHKVKRCSTCMRVTLVVDDACNGLFEAVSRSLEAERAGVSSIAVSRRQNAVPNTVIVERDQKPILVVLLITCSDLQLLMRNDCACSYLEAVHHATECPVYVVVIGNPTGPRYPPFWEGVGQLCTSTELLNILVGVDFAPSVEHADEIVVAHGIKASKESKAGQNLVRSDGRRKCEPDDYHALYLNMLSEIATVSESRAIAIKAAFPSLYLLLEAIDSGTLERVRFRGHDDNRGCSTLDPYIAKVLSTNYSDGGNAEEVNKLVEMGRTFFETET